MELRTLGRTGLRVSELCLGTMTFGNEADEAESRRIVDCYLGAGGNFVDTADVYSSGVSEEIVGRALGARRGQIVLATKGRLAMGSDPNDQGASRRHLTRACEASLRRLGTDWIDLYQVHWPDYDVAAEETLSALDDLVRSGKVRAVGVSNYLGSHLMELLQLSERYGWVRIASNQPQYSLISREIELEILPLCLARGVAVLPWSPLGGGLLSGKYKMGEAPAADTRAAASKGQAKRLNDKNMAVAAEVGRVAAETGRSSAQVALNWVLHRPGVTSPILGARTVAQLEDNLGAAGWNLSDEHATALRDVSRPALPYPHDMFRVLGVREYS